MPITTTAARGAAAPAARADAEGDVRRPAVTMAVSSRTGNTQMIADAVRAELEARGFDVRLRGRGEQIETDVAIVCFWCFKSTLDPINLRLVQGTAGRRILAFGTFGGYPDSPYAGRVTRLVTEAIDERNTCLGVFLSQGKVSLENVEARKRLPPEDPHHLDEAGIARVMESQRHPNQHDVDRAVAFLRDHLGLLG